MQPAPEERLPAWMRSRSSAVGAFAIAVISEPLSFACKVSAIVFAATNDAHLWADTYDRKVTDLFVSEYERAIKLSPNYANAHHWFGDGPLMALATTDRSIAEGKRSVELDPLSLINNSDLGWDYLNARRYDEAVAQWRKTIEIDSHFYLAHYYLGATRIDHHRRARVYSDADL
jgi:tetratricopeptide (TPR) repeat protein